MTSYIVAIRRTDCGTDLALPLNNEWPVLLFGFDRSDRISYHGPYNLYVVKRARLAGRPDRGPLSKTLKHESSYSSDPKYWLTVVRVQFNEYSIS